jgi:hypothetical protein
VPTARSPESPPAPIQILGVLESAGLRFDDGDLEADLTLVNADWPWAQRRLLGREPRHPLGKKLRYGPSALNFYFGVRGDLGDLRAHNVVFGDDYEGHFTDVFAGRVHERARADPGARMAGRGRARERGRLERPQRPRARRRDRGRGARDWRIGGSDGRGSRRGVIRR